MSHIITVFRIFSAVMLLAVPYYYCMESLPHPVEGIIWAVAIGSSLEETLIIITSSTYNSDEKGIAWTITQK